MPPPKYITIKTWSKADYKEFVKYLTDLQDKKYKYMKKNVKKFDNIINNQIKEKNSLELRIMTFERILDLIKGNNNTILYNLKEKVSGSVYNGDYGLMKIYEDGINCLLGLKEEINDDNTTICAPQSWMASKRVNKLTEFKRPIYMEKIVAIPKEMYNENKFNKIFQ